MGLNQWAAVKARTSWALPVAVGSWSHPATLQQEHSSLIPVKRSKFVNLLTLPEEHKNLSKWQESKHFESDMKHEDGAWGNILGVRCILRVPSLQCKINLLVVQSGCALAQVRFGPDAFSTPEIRNHMWTKAVQVDILTWKRASQMFQSQWLLQSDSGWRHTRSRGQNTPPGGGCKFLFHSRRLWPIPRVAPTRTDETVWFSEHTADACLSTKMKQRWQHFLPFDAFLQRFNLLSFHWFFATLQGRQIKKGTVEVSFIFI